MPLTRIIISALVALVVSGPASSPADAQTNDNELIATLYRSSTVIENARIHVATFNADGKSGGSGFDYNWENCQIAADLFMSQAGVQTTFWCEKGKYRK